MNRLLDENVPAPMTSIVKMLLRRSHDVQHVNDMSGWSGTQDLRLYDKAKDAGFQVVVTNDARQMNRKLEVEAIAKSGLHRIHGTGMMIDGHDQPSAGRQNAPQLG